MLRVSPAELQRNKAAWAAFQAIGAGQVLVIPQYPGQSRAAALAAVPQTAARIVVIENATPPLGMSYGAYALPDPHPPVGDLPPHEVIELPVFHAGQVKVFDEITRHHVIRAGRRMGKSLLLQNAGITYASQGQRVGFFAPDYTKVAAPFYEACARFLRPLTVRASSNQMLIETTSGGCLECWTANNPDWADLVVTTFRLSTRRLFARWR